jgi:hypothetical protein
MLLSVNRGRCRPVLTSDEAVDRIPSFSILGMAELWAGSQFRLERKILQSPMNVVDIGSDDIWTVRRAATNCVSLGVESCTDVWNDIRRDRCPFDRSRLLTCDRVP